MSSANRTIVLADPHPLFRAGLRQLLLTRFPGVAVREFDCYATLVSETSRRLVADVLLLDPQLTGAGLIAGLRHCHAQVPKIPIVVLSLSDKPDMARECILLGAAGFIAKSASEATVYATMRDVLDGKRQSPPEPCHDHERDAELRQIADRLRSLTRQQTRVLLLLSRGLLNKQIAHDLGVGETTVKAHVTAILQKLGAATRTQAVIKLSMLEPPPWPEDDLVTGHGEP